MKHPIKPVIFGLAGLVVAWLLVRWLFAPPTITAHFDNAPLSKVMAAFEKQGKIKMTTTMPPDTPVTLHLDRSPVLDAVDLLAVRVDGSWRAAYYLAPDDARLREAFGLSDPAAQGWRLFFLPAPMLSENPVDARRLNWNVEAMPAGELHSYLDQGSQKLPISFRVPADWNPSLPKPPEAGEAAEVVRAIAASTRGKVAEVFEIYGGGGGDFGGGFGGGRRDGEWRGSADGVAAGSRPQRPEGSETTRPPRNENWMRERMETQLAALPAAEAEAARKVFDELRALRESTRDLDEAARREAFREFFSRPEMQERMEQAQAARDAKRTPEQREARYRRTAGRRIEAREQSGNPLRADP